MGIPTSNLGIDGIEKVWPHDRQPDSQHPCTPLGVPGKKSLSFTSPVMTPDPTQKASPQVEAVPVPTPKSSPPRDSPVTQTASPQVQAVPAPTPKGSLPRDSLVPTPVPSPPAVPAAQVAPDLTLPPTPSLSQGAIDRRARRAMEPNAKGQYKVSQEIRKLWDEGNKDKVFKLFADCDHDTDVFIKRFSVKKDHEKELEVGTYFTFQTEEQLAEKPEKLFRMFASPNVTCIY